MKMKKPYRNILLAISITFTVHTDALANVKYDEAKVDQLIRGTYSPYDERGGMVWHQTWSLMQHVTEKYYLGDSPKEKLIAEELDKLLVLTIDLTSEVKHAKVTNKLPIDPPLQNRAKKAYQVLTTIGNEIEKQSNVSTEDLELLTYLHDRVAEFRLDIYVTKEEAVSYYKILNRILHKYIAERGEMRDIIEVWKSYEPNSYQLHEVDMDVLDNLLTLSFRVDPNYDAKVLNLLAYFELHPDRVESKYIDQHITVVLDSMKQHQTVNFGEVFDYLRILSELNHKAPLYVNRTSMMSMYQENATKIKTYPKWLPKKLINDFITELPELKRRDKQLAVALAETIRQRFVKDPLEEYYKNILDQI